ncbi:protein BASIC PENTACYSTEINE1-like [Nymphaea colorata]|nr:protein BASIC PENTACYSTEINE1-like [Nymphaea colorata]XP_031496460.1 protein BASIC PENTACYSTEINE1-like [Nymphaea colorata]XP_049935761.1 protein BASIC PENTACYSTEINE1-like [Nymphaea colorata]
MEDNGGLGIRSWGFPNQSLKENRVLQFMSAVEREKGLMPPDRKSAVRAAARPGNGQFVDRSSSVPEYTTSHAVPAEFSREAWLRQTDLQCMAAANPKLFHPLSTSSNYGGKDLAGNLQENAATKALQVGGSAAVKQEALQEGAAGDGDDMLKESPSEKRQKPKAPQAKKARTKVTLVKDEVNGPASTQKTGKKNPGVVVDGITLDLSCIPIPVCSCTGVAQQCYRWGSGGWQSACCTTSISMYPLPMSTKRRGARIAGRKMSRGAFKKVLEKLLSEGHSLSNPVDLKSYWAKHGTNKFVTIR